MAEAREYLRSNALPHIWCPGCGHGIILGAILRAIAKLGLSKDEVVVVSGIGCAARAPTYMDFNTLHTTHGRAIAFATGIKLAKPNLKVIVLTGDGDAAAIGGNHLIHAARRNIGITTICFNNNIYGMTGGQYSPVTPVGATATTAPYGHIEPAFDLCELAKAAGASFVARGTAATVPLADLVYQALQNDGFSFVEAISQCPVSYGRRNRLGDGAHMLQWQKDNSVNVRAAAKMAPEELAGKIITGVLHTAERPEYTKAYDELILRLAQAKGGGKVMRYEYRLSGEGGQGVILASIILGEAAILDGLFVAQTQSYGPESRGGASKAEVVISDEEIDYPKASDPNIVLALTNESMQKYGRNLKPGTILVADADAVDGPWPEGVKLYLVPIVRTAVEVTGRELATNVVALGIIAAATGKVSHESITRAVKARVPRGTEEMNLKALEAGIARAREIG